MRTETTWLSLRTPWCLIQDTLKHSRLSHASEEPSPVTCAPAPGSLAQKTLGHDPEPHPYILRDPEDSSNCQGAEWKAGHTWKEVGIQTRFRFSCFTLSAVETKAALVVSLSPRLLFLVLTFAQIPQKRSNPSPH